MGKMNLILDLDNTLVCAESTSDIDMKKEKEKSSKFVFHDMDGYYIVFERPNLQEFLDFAFENFNVSVWTAASKDYAIFIIDNILVGNRKERKYKLDYIFYSYHCDVSLDQAKGTKDLSMLWDKYKLPNYNKNNTFIMDDYDEVLNTNKNNCILVEPFNYFDKDSENDYYFKKLMPKMENLKESKNFLQKAKIENYDDDNISLKDAPSQLDILI